MGRENKTVYAILGLLSHEDLTGYDIKKRFDGALSYFWGGSYGSIYPTLSSLEEQGAVEKKTAAGEKGKDKILYSITPVGREVLQEWLVQPSARDELRYETLLKLFFGAEMGTEESLKLIQRFRENSEMELKNLRGMVDILSKIVSQSEDHKYYMITAKFGVKMYEAYLSWAEEVEQILGGDEA